MGLRIVRISREFFNAFLTEGRQWPSKNGMVLKCVQGLPEGARLVGISEMIYFDSNDIALKYEHESWPEVAKFDAIPYLKVEFSEVSMDSPLWGESLGDTPHII
jgi:hypothetical protein